jgi:pyroglutamyl-peptidase
LTHSRSEQPFKKDFPVNPSWEIVKDLPDYLPAERPQATHSAGIPASRACGPAKPLPPVRIYRHPVPIEVAYRVVRPLVPELWAGATLPGAPPGRGFDAVIHLGMAGPRQFYCIERLGHRDGYYMADVRGEKLEDEDRRKREGDDWVWAGCPPELETDLDTEDVLRRWMMFSPVRPQKFTCLRHPRVLMSARKSLT